MKDKYPRGKLKSDDEGALALRVMVRDKTVIVDFGKPVVWIGLSGDDAAELAQILWRRAREAGTSKPITIAL